MFACPSRVRRDSSARCHSSRRSSFARVRWWGVRTKKATASSSQSPWCHHRISKRNTRIAYTELHERALFARVALYGIAMFCAQRIARGAAVRCACDAAAAAASQHSDYSICAPICERNTNRGYYRGTESLVDSTDAHCSSTRLLHNSGSECEWNLYNTRAEKTSDFFCTWLIFYGHFSLVFVDSLMTFNYKHHSFE